MPGLRGQREPFPSPHGAGHTHSPRRSGCPPALHTCGLPFKYLDAPLSLRDHNSSEQQGAHSRQRLLAAGTARNLCFLRAGLRDCTSPHLPAFTVHIESPRESGLLCPCFPWEEGNIPQGLGCRDLYFCLQGCLRCKNTQTQLLGHLPGVGSRHRVMENTRIPKLGWIYVVFPPFL